MSDVFGQAENALPDFVQDEVPAEVTPEETTETILPSLPIEGPGQQQLAETPVEAPVGAAEPRIWAGKYQDPEQLEKGYRELRDLQRRTAERAKAHEHRNMEVEARAQQLEEALRQAVPIVQQALYEREQYQRAQAQNQDPYAEPQPFQPPGMSPAQVAPLVDNIVAQRLQQVVAAQQAQQVQNENYQQAVTAISGFFEKHPEIERNGPADQDVTETILSLNQAWANKDGSFVDISSEEALEIAYEASKNPALRKVLELNPQYIDDDEGMALARQMAQSLQPTTQPPQTVKATPRPNTPFVERGSAQAPQPGKPLDEFDQAASEYLRGKSRGGDSVFF